MATFSRKGYIAIASALRDATTDRHCIEGEMYDGIILAAEHLANWLQVDNPAFNREHFLAVVRGEREIGSRPPRSGR